MMHWLDLLGVAVFAISGTLQAARRRLDPFGALVLAVVTAIGGGTLRDLLLDQRPIFWISAPVYLLVIALAAVGTILAGRWFAPPRQVLAVADAAGLAIFTVSGTEIAASTGVHPAIAVAMGAITGCAGGVLRDILCAQLPLLLHRDIYATAALAGGSAYLLLGLIGLPKPVPTLLAMTIVFTIRLLAIRRDLHLPPIVLRHDDPIT
jgi:uncharacterized membrane protein YeiH